VQVSDINHGEQDR